ncbi:LysR family transcriptional regulator [Ensifer adhaerens]|uniref:LysR family transcriptional regulator n=1 Tax=Ensifer adhaerens TaxID=106592 RepID=UPI001CBC9A85|nr:LysR family transcriptional regulator [Ensifer adhaerens]MBZ7926508.1 LysR family transcriptional regulator [Ensifer adhaerens]
MRNIPTDLLRTFLAVIDLRSHTRAAEQLGRTQPAISLQMKKLQELLNVSLFAKDASAQPTEAGELVASYARQMLALNDEMVLRLSRRDQHGKIRLGIPNDYADHFLPKLMPRLARSGHDFRFEVVCDLSHVLLQGLRNGLYDLVVAMTPDGPAEGAFMTWKEPLAWIGDAAGTLVADDNANLRIVCYPEGCLYRRAMLTALQRDGRGYDLVYTSPSLSGLEAAVGSGFGNTVLARRIVPAKLATLDDALGLPRLADVVVGIYLSSDRKRSAVAESFAAHFADAFLADTREG